MSGGSTGPPPGPGTAGRKRSAVALQVKLACATLDAVKARYPEIRNRRFVLRTRQAWPLDTLVRLETLLSTGAACFSATAVGERLNPGRGGPRSITAALTAQDGGGSGLGAGV